MEWSPPVRRRRKGRPRNSWMQEVATGIRENGIKNIELIDRHEQRIKIKLQLQKNLRKY